jgi:hypothetical protein
MITVGQEEVAQEAGYAGEDRANSIGEGTGLNYVANVHV